MDKAVSIIDHDFLCFVWRHEDRIEQVHTEFYQWVNVWNLITYWDFLFEVENGSYILFHSTHDILAGSPFYYQIELVDLTAFNSDSQCGKVTFFAAKATHNRGFFVVTQSYFVLHQPHFRNFPTTTSKTVSPTWAPSLPQMKKTQLYSDVNVNRVSSGNRTPWNIQQWLRILLLRLTKEVLKHPGWHLSFIRRSLILNSYPRNTMPWHLSIYRMMR